MTTEKAAVSSDDTSQGQQKRPPVSTGDPSRVLTGGTPNGEASVEQKGTATMSPVSSVCAICGGAGPEGHPVDDSLGHWFQANDIAKTHVLNRDGTFERVADLWNGIPEYGAYRTADHQYYFNRKGPVPSVTGILKVLSKDALVQWAKRTVAEFAVQSYQNGELHMRLELEPSPVDQTIKWLASLPDYQRDTAAQLGTSVHLLADIESRRATGSKETPLEESEKFQVSEQEKPYLAAFRDFLAFLELHSGTIISSEKMVWSEEGYAGTYDLLIRFLCQCHRGLWLIDVKTSRGYYPEYALQLAGYGHADYIIVEGSPNPFPMPQIQNYGVLHLRPDLYTETDTVAKGWRLVQYPVTDRDYLAFLACLEIHKWKAEGRFSKKLLKAVTEGDVDRVIQDPLTTEATVPE